MAQEERIINGKILNDSLESSVIHIINLPQKTGSLSFVEGEFGILARENDTLLFSSLLYIPQKVTGSSSVYKNGFLNDKHWPFQKISRIGIVLEEKKMGSKCAGYGR